jgi:hypothetical protein
MTSDRATKAQPTSPNSAPPEGTTMKAFAYHTGVTLSVSRVGGE